MEGESHVSEKVAVDVLLCWLHLHSCACGVHLVPMTS